MTIETKYNVGDEAWMKSYGNHLYCDRIVSISIKSDLSIMYNFSSVFGREENELFPTEEELLKSL